MSETLIKILMWSFLTGLFSAFATGLGTLPVALIGDGAKGAKAWASGVAAGMMLWASLEAIIWEGFAFHPWLCGLGVLAGATFLLFLERWAPAVDRNKPGLMLWFAMLIHSFPEGLAIGVGFATGDFSFGLLLALVISLHNVPEGVAISLALRSEGASLKKCFWFSVYSSLPQPLVAVPAALFVAWAQPLIAPGLGFAGGAMLVVAGKEMLPQAFATLGRARGFLSVLLGGILMAVMTSLLELIQV